LVQAEAALQQALDQSSPALTPVWSVQIDGQSLQALDTAAALALVMRLRAVTEISRLSSTGMQAAHEGVLKLVLQKLPDLQIIAPASPLAWRAQLGASALGLGQMVRSHVTFLGRVAEAAWQTARRPRTLRVHELVAQLGQTGVSAIPVVALVTFLIGVVFAYLLGLQAEQYGANIFVVDGVALGMTREFSPLLVATIMAGRSGAAFTAQLGTMRLTEETDAIRTLGLSAEQVLVLPRVFALMITLPLLVFVGDIAGLSGALVIANTMLDITPAGFIDRLHSALAPRHVLIGLGKSPVFALFIAVIGCRMGMDVARDTRSIGIHTTSTVVQAIVAVIILDAIFAIVCQELGW
ncbi:MAG: MlaE family ABC transporter permease, partial [Burkholderiales bacterium]